jgi:aquaporin Z
MGRTLGVIRRAAGPARVDPRINQGITDLLAGAYAGFPASDVHSPFTESGAGSLFPPDISRLETVRALRAAPQRQLPSSGRSECRLETVAMAESQLEVRIDPLKPPVGAGRGSAGARPESISGPGLSLSLGDRALETIQRDFRNPALEGRRLFGEVFGTFFLVLVAAGGPMVNAVSGGQLSLAAEVTAPGLMVMAIILFMGATSGAHLNPAVTIAFAARGDFPWRRVPGYIVSQLAGAALACVVLVGLFGRVGAVGATAPGPGFDDLQAFVIEIILTLGLVSTILGTASKAQNVGPLAALAVGGYIALAGLWAAPISGASMNPARSLGPEFLLGNLSLAWVYVIGPIVGGLVAVGAAYLLRGPGGDIPAVQAAQGRLHEILAESAKGSVARPPSGPAGSTDSAGRRPG